MDNIFNIRRQIESMVDSNFKELFNSYSNKIFKNDLTDLSSNFFILDPIYQETFPQETSSQQSNDMPSQNTKRLSGNDSQSKVYNFWISKGVSKAGAIALTSIAKFESGFKAASVEKSEKSGKGYGVARNNTSNQQGYGVGLYAWTGGQHKEKALRAGGYDPSKVKIEDLSFDQQLELAYNEFSKNYSKTWQLIKNATDITKACNIAYACLSAGSKNTSEVPSDSYCQTLAHKYMATHAKLGYKKAAQTNQYERRLKWCKEEFNRI